MKKNNIFALSIFSLFLFIGLTGCDDNATPTTTEYTVTFDAGTGGTLTSAATVKVKEGEKVAEPTDPTRDGFTFVEWRKTGATTAFNFTTETITADITLTAQWVMATTPTFTVTFAGEGGTTSTQTVPDGGMAKRPTPDPTRDGFTFVNWYEDAMFNELYDFSTTVTVDITVYAKWLSNTKYTVTFEPDQGVLVGGNDNNTVQISEGEKLPQPIDPTRADHTFVEWQKAGGTAFDFDTETITAPITLTATWADAVGSLADVAIVLNDANTAYTVNYTYTNAAGGTTGGTPEVTWFLSDNANGTAPTQVSTEATYTLAKENRYTKYLVAYVRVMAAGGFTETVRKVRSPGFSTEATSGTTSARFSARDNHTSVRFKEKIWVIGGNLGVRYLNDVWSSADGITWAQVTSGAQFSARTQHTSVVFNDSIWVIGGYDGRNENDVWSSEDGATWTQIIPAGAVFSGRTDHTSVAFDKKIWVIGGSDSLSNRLNDVWSSEDGANWTQVTSGASFFKRSGHSSVAFDDKIWVIGGTGGIGATATPLPQNDVWSSEDGATWRRVTSNAGFSDRYTHTSVGFDGKIWVIGGSDEVNRLNDVWSSSDGSNWIEYTEVPEKSRFSGRFYHSSVAFDDKIWVIGGRVSNTSRLNDVWY